MLIRIALFLVFIQVLLLKLPKVALKLAKTRLFCPCLDIVLVWSLIDLSAF
ncbi:hypothetical protein [Vibrio gallaecicus]|uniref:hypothetical protein n=1 Tax=Vibrio gallaecicus TaxID=552386 RepID=UPI0025B44737|nr:hypothetical protein [Vibrio gallaecicus]MDN3615510.1 hypothetical protein [Vibrio gallaecicus]